MNTTAYIAWVLRRRVAILLICGAITGVSLWSLSRAVFASSLIELFFADNPEYDRYRLLAEEFGDSDVVLIAFEAPDLFTDAGWRRMQRLTQGVQDLEIMKRADSITRALNIEDDGDGGLLIRSYGAEAAANPGAIDFEAMAAALARDPVVQGTILGSGGSAAIIGELVRDETRAVETLDVHIAALYQLFADEGITSDRVHLGGLLPETVEATAQAQISIKVIFPITIMLLIIAVYAVFGKLWPVAVTSGVAVISTLWTFAFAVGLDHRINVMLASVPAVMLVVAFSDIIHLCSAYIFELRAGRSKAEAIQKSAGEVGQACIYTSVTTCIGFLALAAVPAPIFRHTGIVLGVGVALALFLAVTLVPIALWYLPHPNLRLEEADRARLWWRLIDGLTHLCLRLANRHPKAILGAFAALFILSIVGSSRIRVETNMVERLASDNRIAVANRFIRTNFSGSGLIDVYVSYPESTGEGAWLEPKNFAALRLLQQQVKAIDDVRSALSYVDVIDKMDGLLNSEGMPLSRPLLAQYLFLLEDAPNAALERFMDDERRVTRMSVRLEKPDMVRSHDIGMQIRTLAATTLGPEVDVFPAGVLRLFGGWLGAVVAGQQRGLLFALVSTTLMMMMVLRRARAGLMSMIPNILPILTLGGVLGFVYGDVDSDTIVVAMIAVGIAVDDTIHFMSRLRLETGRSADRASAMRQTFAFSGRAIVMTTLVLTAGFAPFALSDYYTTAILGTLLPLTLLVALLADLLLLPALVNLGLLRI